MYVRVGRCPQAVHGIPRPGSPRKTCRSEQSADASSRPMNFLGYCFYVLGAALVAAFASGVFAFWGRLDLARIRQGPVLLACRHLHSALRRSRRTGQAGQWRFWISFRARATVQWFQIWPWPRRISPCSTTTTCRSRTRSGVCDDCLPKVKSNRLEPWPSYWRSTGWLPRSPVLWTG